MSQENKSGAHAEFILRKLHSLTGFFPLCIFLLFHITANSIALFSPEGYLWFIEHFDALPGLFILEWLMIFIPLTLHALMGIWLVVIGKNNPVSYSYSRNWMFFLQRATGIILAAFIVWHIYSLKFASGGGSAIVTTLQQTAHNPILAVFMMLGLISVSFHVCNGLWGFCINWGITPGKRAQRIWGRITFVLFIISAVLWLLVFKAFM